MEAYVNNYCAMIAGNAPLTVKAAKVAIREALKDEFARDLALCKRLVDECFASADYAEGRTAFMEKRKPGCSRDGEGLSLLSVALSSTLRRHLERIANASRASAADALAASIVETPRA